MAKTFLPLAGAIISIAILNLLECSVKISFPIQKNRRREKTAISLSTQIQSLGLSERFGQSVCFKKFLDRLVKRI